MLMPAEKMYMEQPFDPRSALASEEKLPGESERVFLGEEIVDGKNAKKYRVVYDMDGAKEAILQWVIEPAGIPIKTAAADNSWSMEYRNLKIGPQAVWMFELPPDYKKLSYDIPVEAPPIKIFKK